MEQIMADDIGHWVFNVDFDPYEWFGFIYKITELTTGREYIGKKQFFFTNRKIIKGRKNRKKVVRESDWKYYTGSSEHLNSAILQNGKNNYKFEILSLHDSKGSLHYAEVEYLITRNVLRELLEDGKTKKYFNKAVAGVKFIPPLQTEEEARIEISRILTGDGNTTTKMTKEDYEKWIEENCKGENNPMFGKEPVAKNKTYEELYGEEKASQIKKILSGYAKKQHAEGKLRHGPFSKETIEKIRKGNLGKQAGENNPMYGKPCYYNMSEQQIQEWKNNISKAARGKKRPPEVIEKMKQFWENNPKAKEEAARRRTEMNKSLSEEQKEAIRQSNIKTGYERTKKKVESDLDSYIMVVQELQDGKTPAKIKTTLKIWHVREVAKKIEYFKSIIQDILSKK